MVKICFKSFWFWCECSQEKKKKFGQCYKSFFVGNLTNLHFLLYYNYKNKQFRIVLVLENGIFWVVITGIRNNISISLLWENLDFLKICFIQRILNCCLRVQLLCFCWISNIFICLVYSKPVNQEVSWYCDVSPVLGLTVTSGPTYSLKLFSL